MPEGLLPGSLDPPAPRAAASGRARFSLGFLGLAGLVLAAGCGSSSLAQKAANDQDVARDVSWELRKDSRFSDVNASCTGSTVTLRGRVDSRGVEADALKVAQSSARGARVLSELEVRPR